MRRGVAIQGGLGEEGDAVAEDMRKIEKSRVPVVESHAMNGAGHAVLIEVGGHPDAVQVEPARHQWMDIRRDRLGERRNKDARGKWRRLVMAIENHWIP